MAAFHDEAFREGLPARAGLLGDPHEGPGSPGRWRFGGTEATEPHLVLTIASDDAALRDAQVEQLVEGARGWRPLWVQPGDNLPGRSPGTSTSASATASRCRGSGAAPAGPATW